MNSVFLALVIIFAAFFVYTRLIESRQKRVEKKLDELKELVKDSSR